MNTPVSNATDTSATPSTFPNSAEQAPLAAASAETPKRPLANKEQLHQRVDARMGELRDALNQIEPALAHGERALAISTALATGQSPMSGGWERVGEVEAAQLAQWLSVTEDLCVTSQGMPKVLPATVSAPVSVPVSVPVSAPVSAPVSVPAPVSVSAPNPA